MSPFEMRMLLEIYCSSAKEEQRLAHRDCPAQKSALARMLDADMIEQATVRKPDEGLYEITDRGQIYVEKLMSVPLPQWGYFDQAEEP